MSSNKSRFTFIDLFAGIGGIRTAFEELGGECVFSSEWDAHCQKTYKINYGETPAGDIRNINIKNDIPEHDVLVAGFPCQPFSIAGISKKLSLGKKHGFEDKEQGNLFFEITKILKVLKPKAVFLENVKNLLNHDKGNTYKIIENSLNRLGYHVFTEVIDAQYFVPQHRERLFIIAFRKDLYPHMEFKFPKLPNNKTDIRTIMEKDVSSKYTLSGKLWNYLKVYAANHRKKGNGFGYGLVVPGKDKITRTLSARYYKDGSEILIYQKGKNPRRLTPRECARLMGFKDTFQIPVSDTQAYRQFGNCVVVPAVKHVARQLLKQL
jgi:DNA (cytosine-5)-methyltransferase 1